MSQVNQNTNNLEQVLTAANTIELVKKTLVKVGLEHAAPLDPDVLDEKIMKAINKNTATGE